MKIWIITHDHGEYADHTTEVFCIFDSKEKAEVYLKERDDYFDDETDAYEIKEHEVQ